MRRVRRSWELWAGSHESALVLVLILLSLVFTWQNPSFLSWANAVDMVNSHCFLALLAVGVFVVLIAGGIDISFTATAAVAQYLALLLLVHWGGNAWTTWLGASVVGVVLGSTNALLIQVLRVPSIIVTLATLNLYQGLLTGFSAGRWIYELPPWFQRLGEWQLRLPGAEGPGLSVGAVLLGAVLLGSGVLLRWTVPGRSLYALGGGEVAARRMGLRVFRMRLWAFGFLGLLAAWAGLINTLQVQVSSPVAMVGRELDVFAAVVLGGAGITGGTGSLRGTMLGVALIAVLGNGLTLMRVPAIWTHMIIGLILLASVILAAWRQRVGRGGWRGSELVS
jgi:simple sugar transport system permease protein